MAAVVMGAQAFDRAWLRDPDVWVNIITPEMQLRIVRAHIERYRCLQGTDPSFVHLGTFADAGLVGIEYLRSDPVNPRNGMTKIAIGTPPPGPPDPTIGWYWDGNQLHMAGFDEHNDCWYND